MLGMPMARVFLAGAALLAGAQSRIASAQLPDASSDRSDEVAFAVPRLPSGDGDTVNLPRPLATDDARRLRRIFALQAAGDIPAALALTARITNPVLLGHTLADRFLRPEWPAGPDELAAWLAEYPDLPDAPAVFARYAAIAPRGAALPPAPVATPPLAPPPATDTGGLSRNPALDRAVLARLHTSQFDTALRLVRHTRGLDPAYSGQVQAEIAQALFLANRDAEALGGAEAAFRTGQSALAAYVAGLAAWRLDRANLARTWFVAAWRAPGADPSQRAGAAFWAARAEARSGAVGSSTLWLARAAHEPGTFYGQIARAMSGIRANRPRPAERALLAPADLAMVDATPGGHRAFALLQVNQPARAEAELRRLWAASRDVPGMPRALALIADRAGLTNLAAAMQAVLDDAPDTAARAAAPGPARPPRLRPTGGFSVDQALVYGVARVESNFDAAAVSPAGATGLMQLMPVTAAYLAANGRPLSPAAVGQILRDPGGNLRLGQRYLHLLADALDGDLLRMLAAYNSGLGGFNRWSATVNHMDDPLMFLETIPVAETRAYVPRALFYTWTYAAQLGLPAPSLDDLAAGEWPRFSPAAPTSPHAAYQTVARLH